MEDGTGCFRVTARGSRRPVSTLPPTLLVNLTTYREAEEWGSTMTSSTLPKNYSFGEYLLEH